MKPENSLQAEEAAGGRKPVLIGIGPEEAGARLDVVLSLALRDTSRSYLQKLIARGNVKVDGKVCTVKRRPMKDGETVELTLPPAEPAEAQPENIPIDVVYEDDDLLVVNKPRGMVVHPAPGNETGTLVNALLYHCRGSLSTINGVERPGIVHRIDKDTSGLLVAAKTDSAHRELSRQLQEHSMTRVYTAIVYNNFKEDSGTVDAPIGRDPGNRTRKAVGGAGKSREAVTHYEVVERFGKYTLIRCRLETGRTHQIRVHMAYIGHPLLGDEVYGRGKNPFHVSGQMLHAGKLGFIHPASGEYMEFEAPLPEDMEKILRVLRAGRGI